MASIIKVLSVQHLTHDVLGIRTTRPAGFSFLPGQATELSINKPGWEKELRPFTFTSLPGENELEFTIKTYPSHKSMTEQLLYLREGDELILHDVFGTILYREEGIFIAGGAGVTPFLSIFKDLHLSGRIGNNKLIFANKTRGDIILEDQLRSWLKDNFINILSDEERPGYEFGFINPAIIKHAMEGAGPDFYLCGPDPMMAATEKHLEQLGIPAERIIREAF